MVERESGNGGIYDSFQGYRLPGHDEIEGALRSALVVIDANVLLDLYRYSPSTRDDLLSVLESLGDQLFVPHQAMCEFWRLGVMAGRNSAANDALAALTKTQRATADALNIWAKAKAIPLHIKDGLLERVDALYEELADQVEKHSALGVAVDGVKGDGVLAVLENLLHGKVGPPMSPGAWQGAVKDGDRRVRDGVPPGCGDDKKAESALPEGAAGDYLVWRQAMDMAQQRGLDVIMVTSDTKDWWWRHRAVFLGPRVELVEELWETCGQRLYMLQPSDLLKRAEALRIQVREESVADAERVTREAADTALWDESGVAALLDRLELEGLPQAAVIRHAAQRGGTIDRDTVYELSGRGNEQMLRGYTRPTARITGLLQDEGRVPLGVQAALTPVCGSGVKALAFRIPAEMVPILAEGDLTAAH